MYDPRTPPGYGDQFYIYTIQPSQNISGIVNGGNYNLIPVQIQDADFVLRWYAGVDSALLTGPPVSGNGTFQLYDRQTRGLYKDPTTLPAQFTNGQAIVPEVGYPVNSALRFDLAGVSLDVASAGGHNVAVDQLAFYGVRRWKGLASDPLPSPYKFYEKEYAYPVEFTLTDNGVTAGPGTVHQITTQIRDYDFELRRIEGAKKTAGAYAALSPTTPEFAMTLYDANWVARSNNLVNSNRICHFGLSASNPANFLPCPGIVYPINSVIRIDYASLIPQTATLPTITLLFKGIRRIPCP